MPNQRRPRRSGRAFAVASASLLTAALALAACRGQPSSDPRTPPNSPLPKIDRQDDDGAGPRPLPLPPLGADAG